jgi:carboxymethylenebutenolidase
VVVVHEGFGLNTHIEDVCRRFAAEGWLAVAPHLYHRTGDSTYGYDDLPSVFREMEMLTPEGVVDDVDAALSHLDGAGVESRRTGVVGFCLGGMISLLVTARRDIGAGVTFYGGGIIEGRFGFPPLSREAEGLRAPWLGLFGDLDTGIPISHVEELRRSAASSEVETEVIRYGEAGHGFHCDQRASYHAASARDAWRRTLQWLDRHIR